MAIPTDKDGVATLRLTNEDSEVNIHTHNGSVTNPVVKYSDSFQVNVGFVSCQPHTPDYSWLSIQTFSTPEVLRSGIVTANVCGKAKASPEPGELILFVRPLTWWEAMKT